LMGTHLQVVGIAGNRRNCVDEGEMDQCVEPNDDGCSSYHYPRRPLAASVSAQ
jgi:hypothetical protein